MHGPEAETTHSSNGVAQLDLGFAARRHGVLDGVQEVTLPTSIVKRDGRVVSFDPMRIERAVNRCFAALGRTPYTPVAELALRVVNIMSARPGQPTVEIVQDAVELTLQAAGEFEAAKAYILYRAEHAKQRQERPVPDEVRAAFAEADQYFPTPIQKFQFFDKYSRFDYDKGRRETWIETVDRAVSFLHELVSTNTGVDLGADTYAHLRRMILEMRSMPSMRLLAMAGAPARRDSTTIYNCSALPVDGIDAFSEALLISMAGCGVGFSVETRFVEQFPRVQRQRGLSPLRHTIEDSAQGWAAAVRLGMQTWFDGADVDFDYGEIRSAGAPLRTKGGRASGPGPLRSMLEFARARVLARQGMHLRPIDAHDLMCMVGNAAVSGGVRRCLPAGTRVHTSIGALPIEQVREGDLVMTAYGYKPVTGWVDQGIQDVVEVVTESGTIFRCTPNHRVAVLTDVWGGHTFKYARDLTPEDRLLFIARPIDGRRQSLLPLPDRRQADHSDSDVQQPVLDEETAWFLGKFFADGYVHITPHDARGKLGNTQFSVSCATGETSQIERVTNWMNRHGLHVQHLKGAGNWITLRSSNRRIARWVAGYKTPNSQLRIPEAIWRSTIQVRAAFLAGLMDGDGCYGDRPVTVVATVYEEFGREVVKLLATLGIIAEIRCRRPASPAGWQAQWIVTIKDALALEHAQELIGAQACGQWVARVGKQAGYTVPGWMVHRDVQHRKWEKVWAGSRDVWPHARDVNMNSATLTKLVDATHYVPVAVREVRQGGATHTYDIEVRDGSMFVAEGYLVHNTAMLSLFDYDDLEMRLCKSGDFEHDNSQRWNANNSAVWPERGLDQVQVMEQVLDMVKSQRGEPGIFNRQATLDLQPDRRKRFGYRDYLTNPCGEIVLRQWQFCNLSIAVGRSDDTFDSLKEKVEAAAIIGTIQSLATNFPDLRPVWKQNCEEERLLGVDITGQMDSPLTHDTDVMRQLRATATDTNRQLAAQLGINQSAAITTVKPSGNSSQLLNCSSGLHARWAPYYERNVRVAATSPIFKVLRDAGVPMDPENGQTREDANTWVVHFPMRSPDGAITRKDRGAIEQCNYWLHNKVNWTDHNPSVTCTYRPDEVVELTKWIWEHRDLIGGMAFLPTFDANYAQLPYIEISEDEYERRIAEFPEIDFSKLWRYESTDLTSAAQELACLAGQCEVDS